MVEQIVKLYTIPSDDQNNPRRKKVLLMDRLDWRIRIGQDGAIRRDAVSLVGQLKPGKRKSLMDQ